MGELFKWLDVGCPYRHFLGWNSLFILEKGSLVCGSGRKVINLWPNVDDR